jgi:polyisoprenoid-binding protein YceI
MNLRFPYRPAAVAGCAALALLLALPAPAAAPAVQLVPAQSEIGFVSHQMGVPVAGRFLRFDAQVRFDPALPEQGHFTIGVDLASVELPTADAMREVLKPVWFDTARSPRAVFESSAVRALGPDRYEIRGSLSIKGRHQDVVVPVQLERAGPLSIAAGTLEVKRLAFAIGEGEWSDTSMVADAVQIRFRLALSGLPAR